MRRETQNILLILAGGALLKISFSGAYLQYVKPAHLPWLIGGGAVMVALAAISIARDLMASGPERSEPVLPHQRGDSAATPVGAEPVHASEQDTSGHAHDGEHNHSARSAWLLLLPVLAIFLIAPPALGADSVMRTDNSAAASRAAGTDGRSLFPPLPPGEVIAVPMADFAARAAWDSGDSLKDRTVRLTGFIVTQGDEVYLARLTIACCAADAFPVKVNLDGEGASTLADDTWVEAVGQLQPGTATKETDYIPTLTVTGLSQIPQPENPYET
ncbi:TIGR03943 family putative permease subunit [Actinokineospora sp. NPDC004072]